MDQRFLINQIDFNDSMIQKHYPEIYREYCINKSKFFDNKMIESPLEDHVHYHTFEHADEVLIRVIWLWERHGDKYKVSEDDIIPLMLAAYYHDCAYWLGLGPDKHEINSAGIYHLLQHKKYSKYTKKVQELIEDTNFYKYDIRHNASQLLKDADVLNLVFDFSEMMKYCTQVYNEVLHTKGHIEFKTFMEIFLNTYISEYEFYIPELEQKKLFNIELLKDYIKTL